MNAKKAKALRKIIRNLDKMRQEGAQSIPEVSYSENTLNRKKIVVNDVNEQGEVVEKVIPIAAGTVKVEARSKRGLYLHLKRELSKDQTHVDGPSIPVPQAPVAQPTLTVGSELAHTAEDLKQ